MRTAGELVSGDRARKVSIQERTAPWYKDYRIVAPMIAIAALAACYLVSPSRTIRRQPHRPPRDPPKPK